MKNIIKFSTIAMSILMLSSCNAPEIDLDQNDGTITQGKTNYSEALKKVNTMIAVFNRGQAIHVTVTKIVDETASAGKLPRNISTIVNSSFNAIGSRVVTMAGVNTKNLPKGAVYMIKGAITEFDLIEASGHGIDGAAKGQYNGNQGTMDGGVDRQSKTTKLAITFNPINLKSKNYVARASTKNKITIEQKSSGNELAFSILGTGIGVDNALTKAHGIHSSIAILIELSVVELLGRLTNYPYWLLTGGEVNQDVVAHLSSHFIRNKLNKKIQKVSYLLSLDDAKVGITSRMNEPLRVAIKKYKSTHGLPVNDIIDSKLYMSLIGAY